MTMFSVHDLMIDVRREVGAASPALGLAGDLAQETAPPEPPPRPKPMPKPKPKPRPSPQPLCLPVTVIGRDGAAPELPALEVLRERLREALRS
jgi:hypothetical protein